MAKVVGDIVAPMGKFINQQGEEKTRWHKCGILMETDKGLRIKLEALPIETDGWFSVFEKDDKPQSKPVPKGDTEPF